MASNDIAVELKHVEDLLGQKSSHFLRLLTVLGTLGLAAFGWAGNSLYQLNREVGSLSIKQEAVAEDIKTTLENLKTINAKLELIVSRLPESQQRP